MDAKNITKNLTCAGMYFLSKRIQCRHIALEYGRYHSDILGLDKNNNLIEIEVKSSSSGILQDFKKIKHQIYMDENLRNEYVPREFYFLVPASLERLALSIVEDTPYGLLTFQDNTIVPLHKRVHVAKKANIINPSPVNKLFIGRMRSFINRQYCAMYREHMACL